ncbi:MAG: OmpA family protein [Proteobacteria bacterium]|nr:OmpA family protein [Pseudomonadota bacterium]
MYVLLSSLAFSATTHTVSAGDSIQAAIAAASDDDTIDVAKGTYAESLDLDGKSLHLVGNGATLSPTSGSYVVRWDDGEAGSFSNFKIEPPSGSRGLVLEDASVAISWVEIEAAGKDTSDGGAVYVSGGTASFESIEISKPVARKGAGFFVDDAADIELVDVTITEAEATWGAGLAITGESTVSVDVVAIDTPVASRQGVGVFVDDGSLTGTDLDIADPSGDQTFGVGIYAGDHSAITLTSSTIDGCRLSSTGYSGGGIYAANGSTLTLTSVTISDCQNDYGGGIALDASTAELTSVTFRSNSSDDRGGALYLESASDVACDSCSFSANEADEGGAIAIDESSIFSDVDGTFSSNTATDGGAIWTRAALTLSGSSFTSNEAESGGAILADDIGDTLDISDADFSSNTALSDDGGAIHVDGEADLSVESCSFDGNESDLGSGGAIAFAPGTTAWDLSVEDSTFDSNVASDDGGAIYVLDGDDIVLREVEILRNEAADGGGLYVSGADEVSVTRSLFFANEAEDGAAAVETLTVDDAAWTNNVFGENFADNDASALMFEDGSGVPYVANNTFYGQDGGTTANGAAIWVSGMGVEFVNNLALENDTPYAVYCADTDVDGLSDFFHNAMYDNHSDYDGCDDPEDTDGNLDDEDPDLRTLVIDGDETNDDLHLDLGSPCIDAGQTSVFDVDGSVSDIGAYGGPDAAVEDNDGDGYYDNVDCDDSDSTISPGATEVPYDGIDQDCDGVDLVDVDGDGFDGDDDDCDDEDATVNPDATEIWYDGVDQDCDGLSDYDQDLDGFDDARYGGLDCDDGDAAVSPVGSEVWYDGVDQDCDGWSDYDQDLDGYDSDAYGGADCDDSAIHIHPAAYEIPYNGVDEDCDGVEEWDVDGDGWNGAPAGPDCNDDDPEIHPNAEEIVYNSVDENCDGYVSYDRDGDGYDKETWGLDCDDDDGSINPSATETWYDGVDQDCDDHSDFDQDRDGHDSIEGGGTDCDDLDPRINTDVTEVWYDGVDQDCDGRDDDRDGDGYLVADDCDDRDDTVYPGAEERWDGLDNDCDGWTEQDDRDADGAIDWDEWAVGSDPTDPDTDDDGLLDGQELDGAVAFDSDLDTTADVFDVDDDGDGLTSLTENLADPNRDGVADIDVDGDGIRNSLDRDSDGDGYPDAIELDNDTDHDGVPDYVDYNGPFAGGGCAGERVTWLGALALPLLFLRRRRRAYSTLVAVFLGGLVFAPSAEAADAHGYQVLGTTGDVYGYDRLAYPYGGQRGDYDVAVIADHAWRPLVEVLPDGRSPILSNLSTANVVVSGSLGAHTRLEAVVPVHAYGVGPGGSFIAMGDMRLGAVIPAWSPAGIRPGIAIAPSVWIPTGNEDQWVGNPGLSGGGVVSVAQELGRVGWVANVGARAGRFEEERNLRAGAGPLMGVGAHYAVTDALMVAGEATVQGSTGFESFPVELMASSRIRLRGGSWAMVGVGAGLNDAVGASTARVVIGGGFNRRTEAPPEVLVHVVTVERPPELDPLADSDGDGVLDIDDACPEVPIYEAQDPRYSDGCPKLAELSGDRIIITQSIFFREGSAQLLRKSTPVLEEVARILENNPDLDTVLIEGHTNDNGGPEYNYRLSEDRAVEVMRWLIDAGIDRNRLVAQGYGYDVPLVHHDGRDAQRVNRRVEFTVMKREEDAGDHRIPTDGELAE